MVFVPLSDWVLKFRGTKHANADALSRLPLPIVKKEHIPPELVLLTEHLDDSPVTSKQIKAATAKDIPVVQYLRHVRNYLPGDKWIPGEIAEKTGPQMFNVN